MTESSDPRLALDELLARFGAPEREFGAQRSNVIKGQGHRHDPVGSGPILLLSCLRMWSYRVLICSQALIEVDRGTARFFTWKDIDTVEEIEGWGTIHRKECKVRLHSGEERRFNDTSVKELSELIECIRTNKRGCKK